MRYPKRERVVQVLDEGLPGGIFLKLPGSPNPLTDVGAAIVF